jgi:UDPglucose--hexose-1-phosphate uridylyltransferase
MMIYKNIKKLVIYGINHQLITQTDFDYAINRICDLLKLKTFVDEDAGDVQLDEPSSLLQPLLDYAANNKMIEPDTIMERDIFEAKIMDVLIPRPSTVKKHFYDLLNYSSKEATDYFYDLSIKSNYIKTSRTNKNIRWKSNTPYGEFDMTINLSKPEKDPMDIIHAKKDIDSNYPKCLLCKENVGFSGRPGRSNHRIIPIELNKELFHLQYSPYVYYNEHCIVLMDQHKPMNVSEKTFKRLFDFLDLFPHYFLGSNAGLPIVGGSILAHEHYQGGRHTFPIEKAKVLNEYELDDLKIEKLYWPLSVIRLKSTNREKLVDLAIKLYDYWKNYNNEDQGIFAFTDQAHNAITPIARKEGNLYILDITLRNNLTSKEFPLGVFHPHPEHHHIKKENIGLIEVMGLAVLPARLKDELETIKDALKHHNNLDKDNIHYQWFQYLKDIYKNEDLDDFINHQVALKFTKCLEDSGVFKQNEESQKHFDDFIKTFVNNLLMQNKEGKNDSF